MHLEIGKMYFGFKLMEEEFINEINSTARLFLHEKSGAQLLHLENDDDNKVFSISFRTPPKDSTGLPHIMEHSVLCGSRKFPTKEPFVELAKGSLNTFLNAMTFSDKTMYPIASRNDKDFMNLMDVYLDAVFYPNIYKQPEIFMQEGWHYEISDKNEPITYKGVVYNEMKGAFSSPEQVLFRKIQESLFPDTPYGVESGGDPEVIPQLTLEQFLDFHSAFYHPSNSYIYLYGNGDLMNHLKFIDQEYLKDFDRIHANSEIPAQEAFPQPREYQVEYSISNDEKEEDKTFLSMNFVVDRSTNPELYLAFDILEYLLLENPAAPLKKALLESDLGKDVFGFFNNGILQPVFSVVVKNTNSDQKAKFEKVLFDTLHNLAEKGIDKKLIEAAINHREFRLREADHRGRPKGLFYAIQCMDSWLYGQSPVMHLKYEAALQKIKTALTTDYFEELIKKHLLNNTHRSLLMVEPKKGLVDQIEKETKKKLDDFKAGLSEAQIEELINKTQNLRKRQTEPDSPEDLATIPMISLDDIEPKAEKLPLVEKQEMGVPVLFHPMFTNSIAYLNLLFDTRTVPQDLLPYVSLLTQVMGKISTDNHGYEDLASEIDIHTGGITFHTQAYTHKENNMDFTGKFHIRAKALMDKLPKLFELIRELVGGTQFDDPRRLREIIRETRSRMEMNIFNQGHIMVISRVNSYFSPAGKFNETTRGIAFYKFIDDLEKNFDSKVQEIIENIKKAASLIFNRNGLMISYTADEKDYNAFASQLPSLIQTLSDEVLQPAEYKYNLTAENEGLLSPAKVQYVAKGYNFRRLNYPYTGSMLVLKSIMSMDYLWNRIRVQGGAYGGFASFNRNGAFIFASYRDPNLRESLAVYDESDKYIANFDADEREMTKYIIGTISQLDTPLTPSMKGEMAVANYISGVTQEDLQKERDQVLSTTRDDIRKLASIAAEAMKQNYLCVLGNEGKIKENKDLFKKLVCIFE